MTSAELDDLVATLREQTPLRRISADAARAVFLAMIAIGYDLTKTTQPGRRYIESDIEMSELVRWLKDTTPLGSLAGPEAAIVFNSLGLKIQEPLTHPSGIRTTEKAFVKVSRIGAGSSYKVVDKQGLPDGPVSVFNGGISE